jgi:hypothetical protein
LERFSFLFLIELTTLPFVQVPLAFDSRVLQRIRPRPQLAGAAFRSRSQI